MSDGSGSNLLGVPPTLLPEDPAAAALAAGTDPAQVARTHPASSLAWAVLAEQALDAASSAGPGAALGADRYRAEVSGYAYARTGYHRGLDALRRAGWRGQGPVPWSHEPNRGFLRALSALARAAAAIGEDDEANRCQALLRDSSIEAVAALRR